MVIRLRLWLRRDKSGFARWASTFACAAVDKSASAYASADLIGFAKASADLFGC